MLVQTHRDPGVVIPSMNSLLSSLHASMTNATDARRLAEANTSLLLKMMAANQRARATTARGRVLDVRYDDLTRDPEAVVRRIYDHYRLPFTQDFAVRLGRAVEEERRRERPRHRYRAEDFGQQAQALRESFAPYVQEYLAQRVEEHA
jgi:sulfotransferase family protein